MTDISVILTCHREGALVGPAIRSLSEAIGEAQKAGLTVEVLAVLDRADGITRDLVQDAIAPFGRFVTADVGDPGAARNIGVAKTTGDFVTFLDGDDLWSFNWLTEAHSVASRETLIIHSEYNASFGNREHVWQHVDSRDKGFRAEYLAFGNYWDAMSFAARAVYERHPFHLNDLGSGYGHEDWLWNMETLAAGIHHVPAKRTMHFKRARAGTQMAACEKADVVVRDNDLLALLVSR